jgi:hypothetical protein
MYVAIVVRKMEVSIASAETATLKNVYHVLTMHVFYAISL